MIHRAPRRRRVLGLGLGVALLVAASAAANEAIPDPSAESSVQALRERAAAFWAARTKRDFRAQWELLEPRVKGRVSQDDYVAGRGTVRYLAYQIEDVVVDGAFATVQVRVLAQPTVPALAGRARVVPQAALVRDPWIRVGGIWYRRLEGERGGTAPAEQP